MLGFLNSVLNAEFDAFKPLRQFIHQLLLDVVLCGVDHRADGPWLTVRSRSCVCRRDQQRLSSATGRYDSSMTGRGRGWEK